MPPTTSETSCKDLLPCLNQASSDSSTEVKGCEIFLGGGLGKAVAQVVHLISQQLSWLNSLMGIQIVHTVICPECECPPSIVSANLSLKLSFRI